MEHPECIVRDSSTEAETSKKKHCVQIAPLLIFDTAYRGASRPRGSRRQARSLPVAKLLKILLVKGDTIKN